MKSVHRSRWDGWVGIHEINACAEQKAQPTRVVNVSSQRKRFQNRCLLEKKTLALGLDWRKGWAANLELILGQVVEVGKGEKSSELWVDLHKGVGDQVLDVDSLTILHHVWAVAVLEESTLVVVHATQELQNVESWEHWLWILAWWAHWWVGWARRGFSGASISGKNVALLDDRLWLLTIPPP